jgi:hypothetical protein
MITTSSANNGRASGVGIASSEGTFASSTTPAGTVTAGTGSFAGFSSSNCAAPTGVSLTSSNGYVTYVGAGNALGINGNPVTLMSCTKISYKPGKSSFNLNDKVTFEGWNTGKGFMVRNIACI